LPSTKKKANKKKKGHSAKRSPKWFYIIAILIPLIFFVLLEIGLRIFNYSIDISQWVKITNEKYILNPEVARRYFYNTENIPSSNQNSFDVIKKENAFRIFILGGSSAAGYPFTPNGDFGKYIKNRLEYEYPFAKIEVVNIAMTAVNSYTIRDLFPGVAEQKPDLILIYAGHNEYYGALGVGSLEYLGKSPFIVHTALYLNGFKTLQLIRNILKGITGIFSSSKSADASGTLMSRMAKDKLIKLNSYVYYEGLEQYESNMNDILKMAKDKSIPVILGTVASNLIDQPPFVSTATEGFPNAVDIYNNAKTFLDDGDITKADSLFRLAKDLDALRFRAPEAMNQITKNLGKKFNYPVIEVDKEFDKASPGQIVGNNLMVDHLHPTLSGYQLLGRIFYKKMNEVNYLPKTKKNFLSEGVSDSVTYAHFYFSKLDSIIAHYRIIVLKNDWPFSERKSTEYLIKQFSAQTHLDSIALRVIDNKLSWEASHREAAGMYFNSRNYDLFSYEMNLLIDQYPFIMEFYDEGAQNLLKVKQYDLAYKLLTKRYEYSPSAFSTKWLGIIDLSKNNLDLAIKYLRESAGYDNNDPQVLFNLAGAFSLNKEFQKALDTIDSCLSIDPNFPQAQGLRQQLINILRINRGGSD
jgi:tetratricopeptide (TPR) repeat protein